jgi:hypothetical protein
MVTTKVFERSINISETIAREAGTDKETVRRVLQAAKAKEEGRRRQPPPPTPDGGICLREAARKYGMRHTTLVLWVKMGYIPVILETKNEKFINEEVTSKIIHKYKNFNGEGRKTLKRVLNGGTPCSRS